MTQLAQYPRIRAALAEAAKIEDVLPVMDEIEHVKLYARQIEDQELLADAAEYQMRAERRLGVIIAAAKAAGHFAEGRRKKPKNGTDEAPFQPATLEEVGVSKKLSAKAQKRSGIAEMAFEAMVAATRQRIASGRASVVAEQVNGARSIMGSRHEPDESLDYFPTPPWATRALIERVFAELGMRSLCGDWSAWEPAAGEGHIAEVLSEYFAEVVESDIHDYGRPDGHVQDFLTAEHVNRQEDCDWIITNPPFKKDAEAFVLHALEQARVGVAMFLRFQWLETNGRYERVFAPFPPAMIAQFAERVPLHKGRWEPDGDTATAYLWIVWLKGRPTTGTEFFWIPPGQREALEHADDIERFTAHPVIKRASVPGPIDANGAPISHDERTGEVME